MGAITESIEAMKAAYEAFRENDLMNAEECRVCHHWLGRYLHDAACPIERLRLAIMQLEAFQADLRSS